MTRLIYEGSSLPSSLHGLTHYRLLPAVFPDKMGYHFDGLATVLKFHISDDGSTISYRAKTFEETLDLKSVGKLEPN